MNIQNAIAKQARTRLTEAGGRIAQELGLGRIVGQILIYLYLTDGESSLDQIGEDLELSKASISIAARQLENMGLIRRSWKKGDRKNYYRTADNIETALRQGLLVFLFQKFQSLGTELDQNIQLLEKEAAKADSDPEALFVYNRIKRAKSLRDKVVNLFESPFLKISL